MYCLCQTIMPETHTFAQENNCKYHLNKCLKMVSWILPWILIFTSLETCCKVTFCWTHQVEFTIPNICWCSLSYVVWPSVIKKMKEEEASGRRGREEKERKGGRNKQPLVFSPFLPPYLLLQACFSLISFLYSFPSRSFLLRSLECSLHF